MSKLLFLFHGMGVHGADWAGPVKAKLDEVAGRYTEFQAGREPLSARVQLVSVTYDDVFQNLLDQWNKSATALGDYVVRNGIPVNTLVSWLQGASQTENNFFWSHVVDVLLYRFFTIKTSEVRARVLNQVVDKLTSEMQGGNPVEASVLAHSLGTSVAHDSLAYLGSTPINGSAAFLAKNFRFSNIFMVANVGRILETSPPVYQSVVRPLSADAGGGAYCDRYYNFRHVFDPFPAVRAFKPAGWGGDYRCVEEIRHFHEFNVHDYLHYLDHPAVHIPIIKGLLGPLIDNAETQKAIGDYPEVAIPNRCLDRLQALRDQLRRQIALIESSKDPQTLIIAGTQMYAAAQEVADACG
jgi:hypothetical protein